MGSLCRTAPATKETETNKTTNSTQTTTANAAGDMRSLYDRLYQVAGTPYNPYAGPLVANLTPEQQAGIQQVSGMSNSAQPFYQEAAGMAREGAAPIGADDIARYMNPYTNNVVNATQNQFNESNKAQQSQLRGNAALRGALGGDRAGIAGAELARNQKLAQDPVIANMYSQANDKAVAAAQADRAARGQGAYSLGSIGSATQASGIQGGQATIGAGTVQQQNDQQRLGADYQMYLNNQAQPYQQAGWLAQYGMPILQGQGNTQTGTSQTTGTETQTSTAPQASPFSQILGAGMTAAGLFSGNPFMALSGAGSMFGSGSNSTGWSTNPWSSAGQGQMNSAAYGAADGGRIPLPRSRPILNDEAEREDPFLAFPRDERNAMRDLSSLTGTFGERQWRGKEPREPGMVNAFNEWLDKRFYDDNALKWKELQEAGANTGPVGVSGGVVKESPKVNPLNRLAGFGGGDTQPDDPFLKFQPNGDRNAMRDLSSLTQTFGERQWRDKEPREGGMVNNFNEWLDKRFYDDNALKWKELQEQGINARPVGFNRDSGASKYDDAHPMAPLAGFASGGSVGGSDGFLGHVRNVRKALREHYDTGGIVGRNPFQNAISSIESSGRYDALGPILKGNRQALGKYGIMEENLPQWSNAVLGRGVSREEFLKSPEIQDAIFNHRFGEYAKKYGPSGAAKAWFAGERGMNNPNARDALGTSVAGYEQKFNKAMGIPSEGGISGGDRLRLADMSAGASGPNPYATNEESGSMSGPSNSARSRAIAMGLSLLSGGGGSGFAAGGVTSVPKNVMPFEARAEGAFSPFDMSQVPDRDIDEEFGALNTPPMSQPSWANGPVPATGAPFQMTPEEDVEPAAPAGGITDPNVQTAERDTTDGMSAQQRQDPYQVYQQNRPQGSQGDDIRSALVAAGLGMMAGTSSNALTNIGEGGLKGLGQYNVNKKNRESAELAARRLMQQSEQFNQTLDLKGAQFERGLRSDEQRERIANKRIEAQEAAANARIKLQQDREDQRVRDAEARQATRIEQERIRQEAAAKREAERAGFKTNEAQLKADRKRIEIIQKEAEGSASDVDEMDIGLSALPKATTGVFSAPAALLGDEPTQTVRGKINDLVLGKAQKLKGSYSDNDIKFIKEMVGGRFPSQEVIQQAFEGHKAAAQRSQLRSEFYQDYLKKNGSLDGADRSWDFYKTRNPLIEKDKKASSGYRINAQNATSGYGNYLQKVPNWVPKNAIDFNEETRTYLDASGEEKKAQD